jgi:hypothetical protein
MNTAVCTHEHFSMFTGILQYVQLIISNICKSQFMKQVVELNAYAGEELSVL